MSDQWTAAFSRVPQLLAAHVQLSFAALALAMIICLPLAIWAVRSPRLAGILLAIASLIQTIPGLALLALFYPILLGLAALTGIEFSAFGFLPALLALTLYALLPILRNAVTGLTGVDPAASEAADGLGMTRSQKLYLVEAPLAAPTIMAGIRTAAVWTIGAATLSTTVGQPSLGDMIFAGLQTQNWSLVLVGCLFSAALAITVDLMLGLIEKAISERRRILAAIAISVILAGLLIAIVPMSRQSDKLVTIGAKNFSEQYILARLIGLRLQRAGYEVRYRDGLGSAVVFQALANGDIDVYVDYSGTIWTNEMKRGDLVPGKQMVDEIGQWSAQKFKVKLLGGLGFENTYAFTVRPEVAENLDLATLDDLARVSGDLRFGTDLEFLERPEWAAIQTAYPLRFKEARPFSPTLMYPALTSGEVDVISAFSSDGRIAANRLVVLADEKGAIPAYQAILMVTGKYAEDERFNAAIKPLVGKITVAKMREANYMVDRENDKKSPLAAAQWLDQQLGSAP